MIVLVDFLLHDLARDIHGKSADLVLDFIDGFLSLLRDVRLGLCLDAGYLRLCALNQLVGSCLRFLLRA